MNSLRKEWAIVLGAFVAITALGLVLQPRFSFMGGHVWEQGTYYDLAVGFANGVLPSGPAPAVYRFGVPLLASLLHFADVTDGFLVVDLVANLFAIVFLLLFLRLYLQKSSVRIVLVLFYMLHWLAPVRFSVYMPLNVDAWGMLALTLGLYLTAKYIRERTAGLLIAIAVLSVLSVTIRETMLLIPITFAVAATAWRRDSVVRFDVRALLPLFLAVLTAIALRRSVTESGNYHFIGAALNWAYAKPLPTYILGIFIAFGPFVALLILDRQPTLNFLRDNLWLAFFAAAFFVLAYVGGSDTERILHWASPVVLVLLGLWIERNEKIFDARWFLAAVILLQLLSERAFLLTPDLTTIEQHSAIILTSISSGAYYLDLFSYHAPRAVGELMLTEYAIVALSITVVALWLRKRLVNGPQAIQGISGK